VWWFSPFIARMCSTVLEFVSSRHSGCGQMADPTHSRVYFPVSRPHSVLPVKFHHSQCCNFRLSAERWTSIWNDLESSCSSGGSLCRNRILLICDPRGFLLSGETQPTEPPLCSSYWTCISTDHVFPLFLLLFSCLCLSHLFLFFSPEFLSFINDPKSQ